MMRILYLLTIVGTLSLQACGNSDSNVFDEQLIIGTEWILEDLGGQGVADGVVTTVTFPEAGKIAGKGGCNNYFGEFQVSDGTLEIGTLGSTRMMCPPDAMDQEINYFKALDKAQKIELKDNSLLIYCEGLEQPLKFALLNGNT